MKAGFPLDDNDRAGWLEALGHHLASRDNIVLACSALKRIYRDRLRELAGSIEFFILTLDKESLMQRLESREHFMPASLLELQLATLELGDDVKVVENKARAEEVADLLAEGL